MQMLFSFRTSSRWLFCGLLTVLLFCSAGCGGKNGKQANRSKSSKTYVKVELPGAVTGEGWHIRWKSRNQNDPNAAPVPVLDAHAQQGEFATLGKNDTVLLRTVEARVYQDGKPAANIQAAKVTANQRDRIVYGTGGVTVTSLAGPPNMPPENTITADSITWNTRKSRFIAEGHAHIVHRPPNGQPPVEQSGGRITTDTRLKEFQID